MSNPIGSFTSLANVLTAFGPKNAKTQNTAPLTFAGASDTFVSNAATYKKDNKRTHDPRGEGETSGGPGGT